MDIPNRPAPGSALFKLLNAPTRRGQLVWIGLRPERRTTPVQQTSARLIAATGIVGDHYTTVRDGERQVTLIAAEHLAAIASFLGRVSVAPELLRRNLVIRGINLQILKTRNFRIGTALLAGSGDCAPCSHMEEALGLGGYNAVRGHGGITARIIESGTVHIGDEIIAIEDP